MWYYAPVPQGTVPAERQTTTKEGEGHMARTRRIKFTDRDALHHVTSRVSGRQMLLAGAGVKDDMLDALERAAEFSGVNVGAFALIVNQKNTMPEIASWQKG